MSLDGWVRLKWREMKAEPVRFDVLTRSARTAVLGAAETWKQLEESLAATTHPMDRHNAREAMRASMEAANVLRLDGRAVGVDRPTRMLDAVRWLLASGGTELRAPRSSADPWIVKLAPRTRHRGAVAVLHEGEDGTPYAQIHRDLVESAPLLAAAANEGLSDINALLEKRANERAAITAPDVDGEPLDKAITRLQKRRLLAADESTTGGYTWLCEGESYFDRRLTDREKKLLRTLRIDVEAEPFAPAPTPGVDEPKDEAAE